MPTVTEEQEMENKNALTAAIKSEVNDLVAMKLPTSNNVVLAQNLANIGYTGMDLGKDKMKNSLSEPVYKGSKWFKKLLHAFVHWK